MSSNRVSLLLGLVIVFSLTLSLFLKDSYLWMDEILSYMALSHPSLSHVNRALVGNMEATPPLFYTLYWRFGHWVSLNPYVLKSVSIGLYAVIIVGFFRYVTRLIARWQTNVPDQQIVFVNALAIGIILSLTYLHYTLSTQIRSYSLYLLLSWAYVITLHQNMGNPAFNGPSALPQIRWRWLLAHLLIGTALVFTHNVALFYLAASGAFFGLLWLWTKQNRYLAVLASHALIGLIWLVGWYPSFAIQSQAGVPHSWIPLPTFWSFFQLIGDLLPTLSSGLEQRVPLLTLLRVVVVAGLFGYIGWWQWRRAGAAIWANDAFTLFVLAGFLTGFVVAFSLVVSLTYVSVFLNRYFWPSSLLLLYQLLYSGWWLYEQLTEAARMRVGAPASRFLIGQTHFYGPVLAVFFLLLGGFMVYQNRKVPLFSGAIRHDMAKLKPGQPVFVESAYYFLPLSFYQSRQPVYFLLDWSTASQPNNVLSATTDYKILESFGMNYRPTGLVRPAQFTPSHFGRFYVVDESSRYQIEAYIANGSVKVHQVIPANVAGHRILDCSF